MAYDFNGTNQYLSCNAPVTAPPLTMVCFAKNSTFSARAFYSIGQTNASSRYQMQINSNNTVILNCLWNNGNSGVTAQTTTLNPVIGVNEWVHYAGSIESSSNRSLYVRGVLQQNTTSSDSVATPYQTFTVGARVAGFAYADADIAEVGIWNAALTAAEIASLAKGMTCDKVRPQSLVFYAPLVRDLIDAKGGRTITNNNSATVANHPRVYA
jgi:hypothetical protein